MSKRSTELELMDLGPDHYTKEEYDDCLNKLDSIGRYLGGDHASFWAFKQIPNPNSILDVGCGGGQFARRLAKQYPDAEVVGIDLDPHAISFANQHLPSDLKDRVRFEKRTNPKLSDPDDSFDIVTCTLVCHHMTDDALVEFLKDAVRVSRKAVIINDLHRSIFASESFRFLAYLFFRNRLVYHDGPLSVKRAFKKADWIKLLSQAGISPDRYSITWHFAFRWIVTIYA